ncbi:inosine/guanosine/xanthosine phosphorylase family protein [Caulobacter ginsengisoli]|uniref:Purine nucleoside phosphorylase n=1 Tax=Caulobacter ginsengisoli TaxID=400775 RepID=A0ABU0IUC6_9CAUL|nr:purine-nucleoside phosphorylase [Caulobacter ginsengisoli]MDQ0465607.1 inosine/guanosine/xanthosine phosphorylase family protein [Caulobacter ginsengisoli]
MTIAAKAAAAISARYSGPFPKVALVLGSGLGGFGETMQVTEAIPYAEIEGFPVSTVQGHAGRLLIGKAGAADVVCMQGRMHLYEGHPPASLAVAIRALRRLGVETLVLTNAAGGLRPDLTPGSLMAIEDHINLSGFNPLIGPNDEAVGPRFVDMTDAYDPALRALLGQAAAAQGVDLKRGVYLQVAGPNFETPAEIRAFRTLGADAVGMSTVPETLVARHCGMRVAAVSLITNLAAGIADHPLSHAETLSESAKAFGPMSRLITDFLGKL